MALVLCTGIDPVLLKTRRLILERAGHKVVGTTDEAALLAACKKHSFDVAVIGQTVGIKMKRHISALIREHCPGIRILELYREFQGKALDDADSWLETPADIPKDLADHVDELVARNKKAGA